MSDYIYTGRALEDIEAIMAVDPERLGEDNPFKNQIVLEMQKPWYASAYGKPIGSISQEGRPQSSIAGDGPETHYFEQALEKLTLIEKKEEFIRGRAFKWKKVYYIPYQIEGHSQYLPTATAEIPLAGNAAHYDIDVELTLYLDGWSRSLLLSEKVDGEHPAPYLDWMNAAHIKKVFEDHDGVISNCCGGYSMAFYNDIGKETIFPFPSLEAIMGCIRSLRMVRIAPQAAE